MFSFSVCFCPLSHFLLLFLKENVRPHCGGHIPATKNIRFVVYMCNVTAGASKVYCLQWKRNQVMLKASGVK